MKFSMLAIDGGLEELSDGSDVSDDAALEVTYMKTEWSEPRFRDL